MELPENWEKTYSIRAKAIHHAYPDTYVIWYKSPENVDFLAYQEMSGNIAEPADFAEYQPKNDEEATKWFLYQAFRVTI